MYDECYRGYERLRAFLYDLYDSWQESLEHKWNSLEWMARWLDDNGYELRKFEVPDEDIAEINKLSKELREDAEKGFVDAAYGPGHSEGKVSLDISELFTPPAKKMDRCPEDILKEEIENEDK